MTGRDIIVIGTSLGGGEALRRLIPALPVKIPAAVFVALHLSPPASLLGSFATGWGPRMDEAVDREPIRRKRVYVCPSDMNMTLERGRIRVAATPKEWFTRPSINALFRSAAVAYGPRVIGVILTGTLADGVAGLWEIKERGGLAIVQDPDDAYCREMPQAALAEVKIDHRVPLDEMGALLARLVRQRTARRPTRVLIVEDERLAARNLGKRLAELGYEVLPAVGSGEAALQAAATGKPDIVLMDVLLPGSMDGTHAAAILWRKLGLPVIYTTARSDPGTLARIKRTEPYGYVAKPFDANEIHAAIQLALARRKKEQLR